MLAEIANVSIPRQQAVEVFWDPIYMGSFLQSGAVTTDNTAVGPMHHMENATPPDSVVRRFVKCKQEAIGDTGFEPYMVPINALTINRKWCRADYLRTLGPVFEPGVAPELVAEIMAGFMAETGAVAQKDHDRAVVFGELTGTDPKNNTIQGIFRETYGQGRLANQVKVDLGATPAVMSSGAAYQAAKKLVRNADPELRNIGSANRLMFLDGDWFNALYDYYENYGGGASPGAMEMSLMGPAFDGNAFFFRALGCTVIENPSWNANLRTNEQFGFLTTADTVRWLSNTQAATGTPTLNYGVNTEEQYVWLTSVYEVGLAFPRPKLFSVARYR